MHSVIGQLELLGFVESPHAEVDDPASWGTIGLGIQVFANKVREKYRIILQFFVNPLPASSGWRMNPDPFRMQPWKAISAFLLSLCGLPSTLPAGSRSVEILETCFLSAILSALSATGSLVPQTAANLMFALLLG